MSASAPDVTARDRVADVRVPRGRAFRNAILGRRRILSLLVVIVIWQIMFGGDDHIAYSYPSEMVNAFLDIAVRDTALWSAFGTSLHGFVVGFGIAVVVGALVGFVMGRIRLIELMLDPFVTAMYAIPRIALVPLLVLWAGIGFELRVTIVMLTAVFPIIINVYYGAKRIDSGLLDVAAVFEASAFSRWQTVLVPGAMTYFFVGMRIGVMKAIGGMVVAEMTAALTGTGFLLVNYGRFFQTDRLFVIMAALGLLTLLLVRLVDLLERNVLPGLQKVKE